MRKFEGYTKGVNFGGWISQCDHTTKRYDEFITEPDFDKEKLKERIRRLEEEVEEAVNEKLKAIISEQRYSCNSSKSFLL